MWMPGRVIFIRKRLGDAMNFSPGAMRVLRLAKAKESTGLAAKMARQTLVGAYTPPNCTAYFDVSPATKLSKHLSPGRRDFYLKH
jgi:hypothetical protein